LGLLGTQAVVVPGLMTGSPVRRPDQGIAMPTDPAMLARSIGRLNNLNLIRDQPAALQEAVLAAEQPDRDGGTPPTRHLSGGSGIAATH
jgi:hypothetical protein